MEHAHLGSRALLALLALLCGSSPARLHGQAGFADDRVMLQGFYWESYCFGHAGFPQYGDKHWYKVVQGVAPKLKDARFDLIWLPPPSFAGALSAGYNPKQISASRIVTGASLNTVQPWSRCFAMA